MTCPTGVSRREWAEGELEHGSVFGKRQLRRRRRPWKPGANGGRRIRRDYRAVLAEDGNDKQRYRCETALKVSDETRRCATSATTTAGTPSPRMMQERRAMS